MTCTFEQASFGAPFTELDPDTFSMFVEMAKSLVLGPPECQAKTEAAWRSCCVDPCLAITLVTKHLISVDPNVEEVDKESLSERVGDVSVTYANISSGKNPFSNSSYGLSFGFLLRKFIRCSRFRRHLPPGVPPVSSCRKGRW